jgi:hypothetical protein
MGKQPPWIPRAVLAVMITGVAAFALLLLSVSLYRQTVTIAPDWMTTPHGRHRNGYLGSLWLVGTMIVLTAAVALVGSTLGRLLKIPFEALDGGGRSRTFPFNRRPQSARARRQPGSEGYVDHQIDLFSNLPAALRGARPTKRDEPS